MWILSGTAGAYIMEILNLDDLAKDRASEFFFVLGHCLLKGGIGAINPVAPLYDPAIAVEALWTRRFDTSRRSR